MEPPYDNRCILGTLALKIGGIRKTCVPRPVVGSGCIWRVMETWQ